MNRKLSDFLEALAHPEGPMGMFYTDAEPTTGFTPKTGAPFSYDMEQMGELS